MIHDSLDNWTCYFQDPISETIKSEIISAIESKKDFEKDIIPGELLIRTMSYDLHPEKSDKLIIESHKHLIDIQFSIEGCERIDVFDVNQLNQLSYSEEADFFTYKADPNPQVIIHNQPGYFSILFPQDAHRPKMLCGDAKYVQKGVVKMSTNIYETIRHA